MKKASIRRASDYTSGHAARSERFFPLVPYETILHQRIPFVNCKPAQSGLIYNYYYTRRLDSMSESEIKTIVNLVGRQHIAWDQILVLRALAADGGNEEPWTAQLCYLYGVIMGKRMERARRKLTQS